jgi:hypothetical protein
MTDESDDWTPPTSMEEAHQRRAELVVEVQSIEAQLGDHGIDARTGHYTMSLADFEAWRTRAKWALRHKTDELRRVKAWMREHEDVRVRPLAEMTPAELASAIRAMTSELARRIQ